MTRFVELDVLRDLCTQVRFLLTADEADGRSGVGTQTRGGGCHSPHHVEANGMVVEVSVSMIHAPHVFPPLQG